jgi:ribosomal protein S18 acetylase RimI-like enzyme
VSGTARIVSAVKVPPLQWPAALPWLAAAAGPYSLAMFGSADRLEAAYSEWIALPDSEMSLCRAWLLVEADGVIGGYLGLGGSELSAYRKADMFRMLRLFPKEDGRALRARLVSSQNLFSQVPADCFYLSRIGILPEARGRGYGDALLAHFCDTGRARGFAGFRLDVSCDATPATKLYARHGFVESFRAEWQDLCYLAMTRS